jgi:hypothetical protein
MPTGHPDRQRDPLDGVGMAAHNEVIDIGHPKVRG